MALASKRIQELHTQTELLERLSLLTNFSSNLITVSGQKGAGKTWLAQRYLEAWAEDKNQSLLLCHVNQDDTQRRLTIVSQLASHASHLINDSLVDTVAELFDQQACDIVLVIDDAQLLSEQLLSELWALVLEAQSRAKWSISVVLFTLPHRLDKFISRLGYGQDVKPVELEIEALSSEDADRLFEYHVMRFVEEPMEKRVRRAYGKINKIPGEIMALGELKMEKKVIIRSMIGSPMNIILIVLLLIVLIGGGYWWMLSEQPTADSVLSQVLGEDDPAVKATREEQNSANSSGDAVVLAPEKSGEMSNGAASENATLGENGEAMLSANGDTTSSTQLAGAAEQPSVMGNNQSNNAADNAQQASLNGGQPMDDSAALPPSVVGGADEVGADDDGQQRVVIASDVVDALLEGSATSEQTQDIDRVVEESKTVTEEPASAEVQPTFFESSATALMAMPEENYTLQLAAYRTDAEAMGFIERNELSAAAYSYRTLREGQAWYIVTYQSYPSIQTARDAVSSLPQAIRRLEPWAKSLREVHREIERAK
jgi:DamX protein